MPASVSSGDIAGASGAVGGNLPIMPVKKRRKTKVIALVIAAVVLVLGAGSAAAYFGYYLPNKPENVLGQALINTFSPATKSASFEGEVLIKDEKGKTAPGTTAFSGVFAASGAFMVRADVDALVTKITTEARSVDGKSYYMRVGGLAGLDALLGEGQDVTATYKSLIESVNNQWFEINESLLKQVSDDRVGTKLSDADRQRIVDAYAANQFIVVTDTLPDQAIGGTSSYHYTIGIDKTKLKSFAKALKDAKLDSLTITDDMLKGFNKMVDAGDLSKLKFDIWIAKDTKLIQQLTLAGTEQRQTYTARFTVKEYNTTAVVEKPEGAKSIMELLGPFLGGATDTGTDTDTLLNQVQGISL